jgi:hypothetical protein
MRTKKAFARKCHFDEYNSAETVASKDKRPYDGLISVNTRII